MRSPNQTSIKICGVTTVAQALSIAQLGVNAIGVIGVDHSKRFVAEQARRKLFSALLASAPEIERVWVVANMNTHSLEGGLAGKGTPSIIQLHGDETPEECAELRKKHPGIKWWKALRIQTADDLLNAKSFSSKVDALILDAWSPLELGGTGVRVPLEWLKETSLDTSVPWWLAGGISAEWIPQVFKQIRPAGIDASSRLETSPGIKDLKLVKSLIKAIRIEEQKL